MSIPTSTKGIAIYLRVSTEKQDTNTSKKNQYDSIELKIKELNLQDRKKFIYDDTESASKRSPISTTENESITSRKNLAHLIEDAKLGKFDTLFVYSHDRLTRNVQEALLLKYLFKKLNVKVIYCRAGEDLNSQNAKINEFFEHLLNNISQLESNLIGARVKLGNEYKIKQNQWAGGPAPYGYKLNKGPKGRTTLEVSNIESAIVKEVFNYYLFGYTPKDIAELIKIKYPENKDRQWTVNTIKSILSNESYLGYIVWNKKGGARNPVKHNNPIKSNKINKNEIISTQIWEEAQFIKSLQKQNPKILSTSFILKDLIICKDCGKKLKCKNNGKGKKRVYYCSNKKGKWDFCIDADVIETKVINSIIVHLSNIFSEKNNLNNFYDFYITKYNEKIEALKKQYLELNTQLNEVINSLKKCEEEINEISLSLPIDNIDEFDKQKVFLDALYEFKSYLHINKEILEEKIKKVEAKLNEPILDKNTFKRKLNQYKSLLNLKYDKTNRRHIRILLYNFLDNITITHDKNIEINYRLFS